MKDKFYEYITNDKIQLMIKTLAFLYTETMPIYSQQCMATAPRQTPKWRLCMQLLQVCSLTDAKGKNHITDQQFKSWEIKTTLKM